MIEALQMSKTLNVVSQEIRSQNIRFTLDAQNKLKAQGRFYGNWEAINWTHEKCLKEIEARKDKLNVYIEAEINGQHFTFKKALVEKE